MRTSTTLVATLLLGAACSPGSRTGGPPSATPSEPGSQVVASPSTVVPASVGPPVRACETHVVGELGSGWRGSSTTIGPAAFVDLQTYADAPDRMFRSRGERHPTLKVLLVVQGGPAVTISVRDPDRARLFYDPRAWGPRDLAPLDRGDPTMTFEPCDFIRTTQFNGALLATGRTCVTIEVTVEGGDTERAEVPIGLERCASSSGSS